MSCFYGMLFAPGSVPESAMQGRWEGELVGESTAIARQSTHGRWPAFSKHSNEVLHPDVRLPQKAWLAAAAQLG
jgi:hypothetical protein